MSEKKLGKRLLTWVLVLVMMLSLLPVSALANYWGEQGGYGPGGGGQGGTGGQGGGQSGNVSVNITRGNSGSSVNTYDVYYSVNGGGLQTFNGTYTLASATAPYSIVFFVAPKQGYAITNIAHTYGDYVVDGSFYSIVNADDVTQCAYYVYASTNENGALNNKTVTAANLQAAIKEAKEEKGCVAAFQYSCKAGESRNINVKLDFYTEKLATLEKRVDKINGVTYSESTPQKVKKGDVITYALTVTYHSSDVMPVIYQNVVVEDKKVNARINFEPGQNTSKTEYVTYIVQESDITGEELTNTATLTYNYKATFNSSTGSSTDTASASVATGSEVTYEYRNAPAGAAPLPQTTSYYAGAEVPVEGAPAAVDGYKFEGWTTTDVEVKDGKFTMPDGPVKFVGTWTKDTTTYYTVTYTDGVEGEEVFADQSYRVKADEATPAFNGTPTREGYDFLDWTPTVAGTVTGDATYTAQWKKTTIDEEVTVTITGNSDTKVYNGSEQSVTGYTTDVGEKDITVTLKTAGKDTAEGTNVGTYAMNLTAEDFDVTSNTYTNIEVVVINGKLEITPVTAEVTVTITGNTKSVTYDGSEQSVTGFTTDIDSKTIEVDLKDNSKAEAKGAIVGKYEMHLSKDDFTVTSRNYSNIKVVVVDGWLEITPISSEVVVTIKGNTNTVTYDGSEKSVEGYSVKISNPLYNTDHFTFNGTAEAKGTDAGTYPMGLSASQFENTSKNFTNVKFVVTDGELTISKRSVTLTSESDSKVFDGTSLTRPDVTVAGSFVEGEVSNIHATGTITNVGSVPNTIEYTEGEGFKADNYDIVKNEGTLTITSAPVKEFKLTIEYVYADGSTAATSHTESIIEGKAYSVNSPVISGYTADKTVVSGTMPSNDVSVKVTYTKNYTPVYPPYYPPVTPPTVEIEDDDALGLNTTDHFAYIVGYGNGQVRPQNAITRAEVATIFFRLLTDDVREENFTSTNKYTDVAAGAWYNNAVSTLSAMGIITGYPDGTFRPNAYITRAEFAAIAARFDTDGDKTLASFSDIANHWAKDEISVAYNNGWVDGYPDGTFGPQRNITRAETVTLVNRVLNRKPETEDDLLPDMTTWTDNADKKAWYYLAIQEATNSHYYEFKTNSEYEKWTELRETRDWTQLEK